jgi:hypothetical protein
LTPNMKRIGCEPDDFRQILKIATLFRRRHGSGT